MLCLQGPIEVHLNLLKHHGREGEHEHDEQIK